MQTRISYLVCRHSHQSLSLNVGAFAEADWQYSLVEQRWAGWVQEQRCAPLGLLCWEETLLLPQEVSWATSAPGLLGKLWFWRCRLIGLVEERRQAEAWQDPDAAGTCRGGRMLGPKVRSWWCPSKESWARGCWPCIALLGDGRCAQVNCCEVVDPPG